MKVTTYFTLSKSLLPITIGKEWGYGYGQQWRLPTMFLLF